ncbi:MAG: citrate/2-methylcitrate synthase [Nitrososphaera sp.]
MDASNIGLRNIEVADTKICSIDGENGKLIYRGFDILDLVNHPLLKNPAILHAQSSWQRLSYLSTFVSGDLGHVHTGVSVRHSFASVQSRR